METPEASSLFEFSGASVPSHCMLRQIFYTCQTQIMATSVQLSVQRSVTTTSYVTEEGNVLNSYQSLGTWRRILVSVTIIATNLLPVRPHFFLYSILSDSNKVYIVWCHDGRRFPCGKGIRGRHSNTGRLVCGLLSVRFLC